MRWPQWKFLSVREVVLFLAGLALIGHETLVVEEPRFLLVTLGATMAGLPATWFADRKLVAAIAKRLPAASETEPEPETDSASS